MDNMSYSKAVHCWQRSVYVYCSVDVCLLILISRWLLTFINMHLGVGG